MRSGVRSIIVGSALALVLTSHGEVRAHGEEGLVVASTASGGGALTVAFDFGRVMPVSFVVEAGGTSLYTASEQAFSVLSADDPLESLYILTGGTEVSIEIAALEPGKTAMKIRGTVLDAVGESVVLGTQGALPPNDIGDQHPELQLLLALPPGEFGEGTISFKLTTTAGAYSESVVYTLRLSNGHLAHLDLDTSAYDTDTVGCQKTIGSAVRGYVSAKHKALGACLDKIAVVEAREHGGEDAAKAEAVAATACGDKMLAKIDGARDKAETAMLAKCVVSGDLTTPSAAAHLGLAGCRVEELISASYPGAQGLLATFTAGGQPVDTHFPCLLPAPHAE
jgi:hypothetical protein